MKKERSRSKVMCFVKSRLQTYPRPLIDALARLGTYCGGIYLTGGTVRDWLRGKDSADLDCTVTTGAMDCARILLAELGRGALVPLGAPEDDTARVVWRGITVDVTGFREGAKTIEDDLRRRDFTVNALAFPLSDLIDGAAMPTPIDPVGGGSDLDAGVLRACENAFIADPLRMLRGFRLSAVLGYAIDAPTLSQMDVCAPLIENVAAERISRELNLIMGSERACTTMTAMARSAVFKRILPEVMNGLGLEQPGYHHLDVFHHSLATLGSMEEILRRPDYYYPGSGAVFTPYIEGKEIQLKWSALLHDLGKPLTKAAHPREEGRIIFYNHDRIGREVFSRLAGRLKWSNAARDMVGTLIELHMHPFHLCNIRRKSSISSRACLKIWKKAGEHLPGLFLLAMADSLAGLGEKKPAGMEDELAGLFRDLQSTIDRVIRPVFSGPRLVTGRDLIEVFHLAPGPAFSPLLAGLELAMVEGHVHDREEALDWVAQYLQNGGIPEDTP
jgi:poly(A) polymerase